MPFTKQQFRALDPHCHICNTPLAIGVNWTEGKRRTRTYECKSCNSQRAMKWAKTHSERVQKSARAYNLRTSGRRRKVRLARISAFVSWLKAMPCTDCGREFPPECMDFDHVRGTKVLQISRGLTNASLNAFQEELTKCELVCACCHRSRTKRRLTMVKNGE